MSERFKDVKGYEGLYQVSETGNVKSVKRNALLKQTINKRGYSAVTLSKNGVCKFKWVHRIVAETFIANPEFKSDVNHKDGVKTNNNVLNLEWATRSENIQHAYDTGLAVAVSANEHGNMQGELHGRAKLSEDDVIFIRKNIRRNEGSMTQKELAKKFNVSIGTISAIVANKTWKHVMRHLSNQTLEGDKQ